MGTYWSVEECAWVECPAREPEVVAEAPEPREAPVEPLVLA
ncbi:MAG: hypothetical protein JWM02_1913 [Frankiales bacterium]|nr:hypothetical protein [Frankiales bacterium]